MGECTNGKVEGQGSHGKLEEQGTNLNTFRFKRKAGKTGNMAACTAPPGKGLNLKILTVLAERQPTKTATSVSPSRR